MVVWYVEQEEPWVILTDLPPKEVGVSWYALRFWIELGFKAIKSLGWKWDKTRRTDPARISRHWLVLSVATLLALAYGTRVEDAQDRRIAPGNLRTPPKTLASNHRDPRSRPARTVSVIRHGIDWLRRLLLKGRLWSRVWLLVADAASKFRPDATGSGVRWLHHARVADAASKFRPDATGSGMGACPCWRLGWPPCGTTLLAGGLRRLMGPEEVAHLVYRVGLDVL